MNLSITNWFDHSNHVQNTEVLKSDTSQYLKIHKNGTTFVQDCFKLNYPNSFSRIITSNISSDIPLWTTIRDPYQRFTSGLAYDIKLNNRDDEDLEEILNNINYKKLFLGKMHPLTRIQGNINHCLLQFTYLFNFNINFCVDVDVLNTFIKMHYENPPLRKNEQKDLLILTQISDIIQNTPKIKQVIDNYLSIDYYIINELYNNNLVWNWQNGKMF